jgi:hypothetical protein
MSGARWLVGAALGVSSVVSSVVTRVVTRVVSYLVLVTELGVACVVLLSFGVRHESNV